METLHIAATDDTPEVNLNKIKSVFEITGRSLPEDVISFYSPVFSWFEQYVGNPNNETLLKVQIDYFNSASQRALNEIFTILSRILAKNKTINVEWHFNEDDDEMREAGKEFADITNLPFRYISYVP